MLAAEQLGVDVVIEYSPCLRTSLVDIDMFFDPQNVYAGSMQQMSVC